MDETPAITKNKAFKETFQRGTVVFPVQYSLCNTVNPHYDLPLHWHEEYELIHVISGSYNIFIAEKDYTLEKGDLCLIPGNLIHGDAQDKGMALYESVVFDLDVLRLHSYSPDTFFSEVQNGAITLDYCIPAKHTELCQTAVRFFDTIKVKAEGYDLISAGLLMILFGLIKKEKLYRTKLSLAPRSKDVRADQIAAVLNLIRKNYGQDLSLQQMSDTAALSPKYFCRLFKESTGHTPIEYLNWFRVNRACTLLRESQEKLLDIALDCGFNDFSYFTKIFHRYKGMPPSKYRNFDPLKAKEIVIDPDYLWEKRQKGTAAEEGADAENQLPPP